jgi:hypothetical protein
MLKGSVERKCERKGLKELLHLHNLDVQHKLYVKNRGENNNEQTMGAMGQT